MPKFGEEGADEAARDVIANAFPDREVVQVTLRFIPEGGGGIHCITLHQPAAGSVTAEADRVGADNV
jgi:agmatine deiminase